MRPFASGRALLTAALIAAALIVVALTAVPLEPEIAAALAGVIGGMASVTFVMEGGRRGRSVHAAVPATQERREGWSVRRITHRDRRRAPSPTTPDRRRSTRLPAGTPLIGYVTVSANAPSGEAERSWAAIEAKCERSAWSLLEIVHDRENRRIRERPGLRYALERIVEREADGLIVSDLHRLSRSAVDLGALLAWFRDAHATLIALDLGIDTSTPEGDWVAATLIALGGYEHERISSRTRKALAEVRSRGSANGRPAVSDRPELVELIAAMRASKMTLQAIADQLNAEGVPTLRGGAKWRPSSIQAALGYRRPGTRDRLPSLKRDRA
jgi:DNA invertase Pin-like site-specific DNA recombinase